METYKDTLTSTMSELGKDSRLVVIGYNVTEPGGFGGGTFRGVPKNQLIEMPLAECNMTGVAIGMALGGYIPLLWFERFDFVFHALDAIVNHLNHMETLSQGRHAPGVIIRTAIGGRTKPLFTGPVHTQDLTIPLDSMVKFPVRKLLWKSSIATAYESALEHARGGKSTVLVEDKDLYDQT